MEAGLHSKGQRTRFRGGGQHRSRENPAVAAEVMVDVAGGRRAERGCVVDMGEAGRECCALL